MREDPVPLAVGGLEAKDTSLAVLTRIAGDNEDSGTEKVVYKDEDRNQRLLARGRH